MTGINGLSESRLVPPFHCRSSLTLPPSLPSPRAQQVYVLSTIPTWYLVDIWGRRPILLSGALVMAFALSSVGYFLYLDKSYTPTAVVISVITFNAAFGFSWGPIPWLFPPEVSFVLQDERQGRELIVGAPSRSCLSLSVSRAFPSVLRPTGL